jgi:hypothetical protein
MLPDMPQRGSRTSRLSSWRRVAQGVDQLPPHPRTFHEDTEYLRDKLARLASLSLTSVHMHDVFVTDLKAYVTKALRDPELQQLVEDHGDAVLYAYTKKSFDALRAAMERVIDDKPTVIIEQVPPPAPRPKSLLERLLGG